MTHTRNLIRKQLRKQRRALTPEEQQTSAEQVCERLSALSQWQHAEHIAIYLSVDGELSTQPIIEQCWKIGKSVYLPVLHPFRKGHLLFQSYTPDTPMCINSLKIKEPKLNCQQIKPINQLDMLLTPLVAFDPQGNRLGMGGGFYDRTMANLNGHVRRIGVAHDLQCYPELPIADWDEPLHQILTPSKKWDWS
ncbi:MAG: 5-formyltetrahydrofolate cyclo-ligase [Candidatus Celerinatantimonas neptuna]|nr:MAG: 5-formyltetrahydrofolate cyclo-ligase [Candidatus Celerinatantimonas neptuna]